MTVLVAVLAAAVAAAVTWFGVSRLAPAMPLRRANYRGVAIPTGLGILAVAGLLAGAAFLALVSEVSAAVVVPGTWIFPIAAAGTFAALGLFDDVFGTAGGTRGFRGHAGALSRGALTSGGVKLVAGSAVAFALGAPATDGFGFALVAGVVIALSANVLNAFDLRPGRAGKAFLAGALPLAAVAGPLRGVVCAAIGAAAAFLPYDLRERAMAGDAGANAFGAFLGACAVLLSSRSTLLVVAGALATLQILAEGFTFSKIIGAVPPLRAADAWGRVAEDASVGSQQDS